MTSLPDAAWRPLYPGQEIGMFEQYEEAIRQALTDLTQAVSDAEKVGLFAIVYMDKNLQGIEHLRVRLTQQKDLKV